MNVSRSRAGLFPGMAIASREISSLPGNLRPSFVTRPATAIARANRGQRVALDEDMNPPRCRPRRLSRTIVGDRIEQVGEADGAGLRPRRNDDGAPATTTIG